MIKIIIEYCQNLKIRGDNPDSTGFCGHVFSGAYEFENGLGSGSGKSFEDI